MTNDEYIFYAESTELITLCDKVVGLVLNGSGYRAPFQVGPTSGTHDYLTCTDCQKSLKEISTNLRLQFEGKRKLKAFPFCCPAHENLISTVGFKIQDFAEFPDEVAKKITFTKQHIINNQSDANWYKIITDYIEYVMESFGEVPLNCGRPLYLNYYKNTIKDDLQNSIDLPIDKKNTIISFMELLYNPSPKPKTDFNILIGHYEEWLKYFPFELKAYFGNLREHFENLVPLLDKSERNFYSGKIKAKVHTKETLFAALIALTKNLFNEINAQALYEKGLITDANKNKILIEIAFQKDAQLGKDGYLNTSPDEDIRYRRMVKNWLDGQLETFKTIAPYISSVNTEPIRQISDNGPTEPTYLTHLLNIYYEKERKLITIPMVLQYGQDNGVNISELKKRLTNLNNLNISGHYYKASGKKLNNQAFGSSYKYLLSKFEHTNIEAYKAVENDHNQLKELYPEHIS